MPRACKAVRARRNPISPFVLCLATIAPFAPHRRTAAKVVNARGRPSRDAETVSGSCKREPEMRWVENASLQQHKRKGGLGKLFFPAWLICWVDGGDTKPVAVAAGEPTAVAEFRRRVRYCPNGAPPASLQDRHDGGDAFTQGAYCSVVFWYNCCQYWHVLLSTPIV